MISFKFDDLLGVNVRLVTTAVENDLVNIAKKNSGFAAKASEVFYIPSANEAASLLVGLGEAEKVNAETLREAAFKAAQTLKSNKVTSANVEVADLELDNKLVLQAVAEGFLHSDYKFSRKTGEDANKKEELAISLNGFSVDGLDVQASVEEIQNLVEGIFFARDLANITSNEMHPETLANEAKEKLEPLGVKVTIFDEQEMQDMGMEAAYAVGKGSDFPPRFVVMEYNGDDSTNDRLALVGKAICYDSGGYSLKPSNSMKAMHDDMGGAATVIGAIFALAKNNVKTNVIGTFAATENLVSGKSYRVGDIIGSLSGKTIEIENTDAEGRVTLADSVHYASKQENVTGLIDIATLTGAALSALAREYTAVITNNDELFQAVKEAGERSGEKVWELPNDEVFKKMNHSKVADLTNSAGGGAGSATAGLFVGEFLDNQELPWVHLDIAGTAWLDSPDGYLPTRATGVHVKTFYNLLNK